MITLVSFVILHYNIQLGNVIFLFPGTKLLQISTKTSSETGIKGVTQEGTVI